MLLAPPWHRVWALCSPEGHQFHEKVGQRGSLNPPRVHRVACWVHRGHPGVPFGSFRGACPWIFNDFSVPVRRFFWGRQNVIKHTNFKMLQTQMISSQFLIWDARLLRIFMLYIANAAVSDVLSTRAILLYLPCCFLAPVPASSPAAILIFGLLHPCCYICTPACCIGVYSCCAAPSSTFSCCSSAVV